MKPQYWADKDEVKCNKHGGNLNLDAFANDEDKNSDVSGYTSAKSMRSNASGASDYQEVMGEINKD